ncbi:ABC transporter permease [Roseomonas sp. OT10]|uniref:ABC transporter permease n=1 Tax=Roseomonas cutis TaxID=2897332 RepID=UPI001E38B34C|nr:ABC transporter permease [Roseomonas sp. OT10]UFN48695.1 ABC transporter permease [Roseomonas sp. OT10]
MSASLQPVGRPAQRSPLVVQVRVIGALIMREMQTRFGRHNLGFLWLFLEPLMLGTVLGTIHALRGHSLPGGLNPFMFSIVGYVPFFVFRAIVNRAPSAVHSNLTLLFHRQVTLFDIVTARNLLEAASITMVIMLVLGFAGLVWDEWPEDVRLIIMGVLCMLLLSHGLAMLLAAGGIRWESFDRLIHPVTYLTMPISGAFFALHWFSPDVREALLWVPLVNIHEMIRDGYFGSRLPAYYSVGYIIAWIAATNLLGMAALRSARRQLTLF